MVNFIPKPHYSWERTSAPIQESGWSAQPILTFRRTEKLPDPAGSRTTDSPARNLVTKPTTISRLHDCHSDIREITFMEGKCALPPSWPPSPGSYRQPDDSGQHLSLYLTPILTKFFHLYIFLPSCLMPQGFTTRSLYIHCLPFSRVLHSPPWLRKNMYLVYPSSALTSELSIIIQIIFVGKEARIYILTRYIFEN